MADVKHPPSPPPPPPSTSPLPPPPLSSSTVEGERKAPSFTFISKEEHFQSVSQGLSSLKASERLTDLHLICAYEGRFETLRAHAAILAPRSRLLRELCMVAKVEQLADTICISLDNVDGAIVAMLLEYLYLGKVLIPRSSKNVVARVCKLLELDICVEEPLSSESSESSHPSEDSDHCHKEVTPPVTMPPPKIMQQSSALPKKPKMGPKGKMSQQSAQSVDKHEKPANGDNEAKEKKQKANSHDAVSRSKSSDSEPQSKRKQELKKSSDSNGSANKANPLFAGRAPSNGSNDSGKQAMVAPQKRRMAELDKKVEVKDSKKMRQDDSTSDVDSDELAKRKSEVPQKQSTKKVALESSESEPPAKGTSPRPQKKSRPGPASKTNPAAPKAAAAAAPTTEVKDEKKKASKGSEVVDAPPEGMFVTEGIQMCKKCGSIFVSIKALQDHVEAKHLPKKKSHSSSGSDSSSSLPDRDDPPTAKKPTFKKKSASKIKEERQEQSANRSSSTTCSSDDDEGLEKQPPHKKNTTPKIKVKLSAMGSGKSSSKKKIVDDDVVSPKIPRRLSNAAGGAGEATVGCTLCEDVFDKASNLRNHVVNHFKVELYQALPSCKPFLCPECQAPSRDRITLMRHYAFTHKMIHKYCSVADLAGRPLRPGGGVSLSAESPVLPKKQKSKKGLSAKKEKEMLAESLLSTTSNSSDTDGENVKSTKTAEKSKGAEISNGSAEQGSKGKDDNCSRVVQPLKFSDESEDDLATSSAVTLAINQCGDSGEESKNKGDETGQAEVAKQSSKEKTDSEPVVKKKPAEPSKSNDGGAKGKLLSSSSCSEA